MITKIAEFNVRIDDLETARASIREFVNSVHQNETTTLRYEAYEREEGKFIHFMQFKDEEAEKHHQNTDYVHKFVSVLYPLCSQEPVFTDLMPVG